MERRPIEFAPDCTPTLFVIVDTEEEFDWGAPFSPANTSVSAMRHIARIHDIFAKRRIKPTYVIDYPIATQPEGYLPLKERMEAGECAIGAHLHPWVTPPMTEAVNQRNSYGCNLDPGLERAKLRNLKDAIAENVGIEPKVYKAGRYGFGVSTAESLEELGFDSDASINPHMDFSSDGGPSFETFDARPFMFGQRRTLLELPCSTGYAGLTRAWGTRLHRFASSNLMQPTKLVGVLARTGLLNKIMLTPEGAALAELKLLTRALLEDGVRTFSLTMHSPSAKPGCTPYVRSDGDLRAFQSTIEGYCDFFLGELGGNASTPEALFASLGCADAQVNGLPVSRRTTLG
jgi:hypothetical protein